MKNFLKKMKLFNIKHKKIEKSKLLPKTEKEAIQIDTAALKSDWDKIGIDFKSIINY